MLFRIYFIYGVTPFLRLNQTNGFLKACSESLLNIGAERRRKNSFRSFKYEKWYNIMPYIESHKEI
jgi:hypothetical protein